MLYTNYAYYTEQFGGTLDEKSFKFNLNKASKIIDRNINREISESVFNELSETDKDKFNYVCCELIEMVSGNGSNGKQVTSISIDGISKSYKALSNAEETMQQIRILDNLPLQFRKYL